MGLTIVDCISDPGSGAAAVNEDIAGHGSLAAWVLDGATGLSKERLLPGPSDAAWLSARFDALLRERADRPDRDPRVLISDLIAEVARNFEAERIRPGNKRYEMPSAGMAFIRLA